MSQQAMTRKQDAYNIFLTAIRANFTKIRLRMCPGLGHTD